MCQFSFKKNQCILVLLKKLSRALRKNGHNGLHIEDAPNNHYFYNKQRYFFYKMSIGAPCKYTCTRKHTETRLHFKDAIKKFVIDATYEHKDTDVNT